MALKVVVILASFSTGIGTVSLKKIIHLVDEHSLGTKLFKIFKISSKCGKHMQ